MTILIDRESMFYKIIFTLCFIIGSIFVIRTTRKLNKKVSPMQNVHIPNAFRAKTNALLLEEQRMFKLLQTITEKTALSVFPKPQLSAFITLDSSLAFEIQEELMLQLQQMHCDFMLVSKTTYSPIVALSFDAPVGLQKLLSDLGIALVSLQSQQSYDEDKLKTLLAHYL